MIFWFDQGNITVQDVAVPGQCECHSTLIKVKDHLQTFPLQNTPAVTSAHFSTFPLQPGTFAIYPLLYPTHQSAGGKPSINEQIVIVIRLAVQGDGPSENKRNSCLINGDINHGVDRLAKRRSISRLIYL